MIKAFVLALLVTGSAHPSFAQNAFGHITVQAAPATLTVALPGSLHDTMKAMSRALKSIDAADSSKNAANAKAADDFAALATHAKSFSPDGIDKMPAGSKAKFDQELDQTAALGRQLAAAFRAGEIAKVQKLMGQLDAAKKQGHGDFK